MRRRPRAVRGLSRCRGSRPLVEFLERRELLATFTVNSTADDDVMGTLRWAINQSNASPGQDTIAFAIPGAGPHTIQPLTALPTIIDQVLIDGSTQGGATPLIEIDGSLAGAGANGLTFSSGGSTTASGSVVRQLVINRFSSAGIAILSGANTVAIRGSFLGTDPTGTIPLPNDVGVAIRGSFSNTVGGVTTDFRNLISGNRSAGVHITGANGLANVVQANIIGLTLGGNSALPNQGPGVLISGDGTANSGARSNTVGGSVAAARNFISGNVGPGVLITDAGATANRIQGNFIGTNTSGTTAIANAIGVHIRNDAASNSVGGAALSLRNVISGNGTAEILIEDSSTNGVAGNLIGTNADGTSAIPGRAPGTVGILIRDGAANNTIGGTTTTSGNVISGLDGAGIWIRGAANQGDPVATANVVQGNVIGAAIGGTSALPNETGILLSDGTTLNTIGGSLTGAANVISGNSGNGIELGGAGTNGNIVQGNRIGVASDGASSLPNGENGVLIDGAINSLIGGTVTGQANIIAFNGETGVRILAGTGNALRRNSIFANGDLGIIVPFGLQNAPVLTGASTSTNTTTITGTLAADANTTYTIEFYSNQTPDPSGAGEGQTFLGQTTVTTDSNGGSSFTAPITPAAGLGLAISAIAIAPNGNTSQFAENVTNTEPTADISVTMTAAARPPAPAGQVPTNTLFTYTIVVTNNGPNNVATVTVTDPLPANTTFVGGTSTSGTISQVGSTITVTIPTLSASQSATITLTIVSPSTIPAGGTITNTVTATAGSGGSDPDPGNNSATVTTTVVQGVDLSTKKSINPNPGFLNGELTIVLTVTNMSTVQATNVTVTDVLPASFQFLSATSSQGTVTESGGVVTAFVGTLPPSGTTGAGGSAVITILVRATAIGSFTNTATAVADQPQTVANDNIASASVTIQSGPAPSDLPPQITMVRRTGSGGSPTRIQLLFNEPMDATSVNRIENYILVSAGRDGQIGTPDDQRIALRSARYDPATNIVTLTSFRPYSLHLVTQLTVVGRPTRGLRGVNNLFLDGAGTGQQGTNFVVLIRGTGPISAEAAAAFALAQRKPPLRPVRVR